MVVMVKYIRTIFVHTMWRHLFLEVRTRRMIPHVRSGAIYR